jgi:hypothetical protein
MSFCLQPHEAAGDGLKRLARRQLDGALDALAKADAPPAEVAYAVRRRLKRFRAIVLLARAELGDAYKAETAWRRETSRPLTAAREAAVLGLTLESVAKRHPDMDAALLGRTRDWAQARQRATVDRAPVQWDSVRLRLIDRIAEARARVAEWPLQGVGFEALGPGLRRACAQGRRALTRARRHPEDALLHDLRKHVKNHGNHLRLLEATWPRRLRAERRALDKLARLLGDAHDLAMLEQALQAARPDLEWGRELDPLLEAIARDKATLGVEALSLARRAYAEKPSAFLARLQAYWQASRKRPAIAPAKAPANAPASRNEET